MSNLAELQIFVEQLMDKLEFPLDAQEDLLSAMTAITSNNVASAWFLSLLEQYEESTDCNYKQILDHVKELGITLNVHEYTITMLLLLCMAKKLKERYTERKIEESVWLHSLRDLRYRLYECRSMYSINGTFSYPHHVGFYKLTRFAYGRLQFEMTLSQCEYTIGGTVFPVGTKQLSVHIPNTGTKMDHDEVLESYCLASKELSWYFDSEPIIFTCYSWLLYPWNLEILAPTSNIVQFYNDYKIIATGQWDYKVMWLLFGCPCDNGTADLPRKSTLQRAYAERMDRGEPIGWGRGVFVYRDGKIIND